MSEITDEIVDEKRLVTALKMTCLVQAGHWVTVETFPLDSPMYEDDKDLEKLINELHKIIYKSEKAEFKIHGKTICIRSLDKNFSIIKLEYIYKLNTDENSTINIEL